MALKFEGPLNKNMEPRIIGLLMSEQEVAEKRNQWAAEDIQNLTMLCEHFGIESGPNQYLSLSVALAREIVPCFQVKPKEGRRQKWDDYSLGLLAVEIERITETGKNVKEATRILAARDPWKKMIDSWDEERSLSPGLEDAIVRAD